MIPQRITIEGFLSYGRMQEIDLTGLGLCMLSGPNGTGKSSVFDAITFALFGEHRGGKTGHDEVIHNGQDSAAVEFEFHLDGAAWRVRRTLTRRGKKASGARTLVHKVNLSRGYPAPSAGAPAGPPPAVRWEVVPETSGHADFDLWVARNVGMSLATFTCSMLLRQGEADRLLTSSAAERFAILKGVVGLEHYERLEALAVDHRRRCAADVDSLAAQIDVCDLVGDEPLARAAESAEAAGQAAEEAAARVEAMASLVEQSRQWAALRDRLNLDLLKAHEFAGLLRRGADIETGGRRLAHLRALRAPLAQARDHRQRLEASRRRLADLAGRSAKKQEETSAAADRAAQAAKLCQEAEQALLASRQREQELLARRRDLDGFIKQAEPYETARRDCDQARRALAALPPDPAGAVAQAQLASDKLECLRVSLPPLDRLAKGRAELVAASNALPAALAAQRANAEESLRAGTERAGAQRKHAGSEATLQACRERCAAVAAVLKADTDAVEALRQTEGKVACPACGQELTDEHRRREEHARRERRRRAEASAREADARRQSAEADSRAARQAWAGAEGRCRDLADRGRDLGHAVEQARRDAARHAAECRGAYDELPEAYRRRILPVAAPPASGELPGASAGGSSTGAEAINVEPPCGDPTGCEPTGCEPTGGDAPADWARALLNSYWPTPENMACLRRKVLALPDARRGLAEAREALRQWQAYDARVKALADVAARRPADLPADLAPHRAELARLISDHAPAAEAVRSLEARLADALSRRDRAAAQQLQLADEAAALARDLGREEVNGQLIDAALGPYLAQLPGEWAAEPADALARRAAEADDEARSLESAGVEADLGRLREAREQSQHLEARVAECRADAAALPPESRREPAEVEQELRAAKARRLEQEAARQQARAEHERLSAARRHREGLLLRSRAADRRHRHYKLLAEILGRTGLQGHLLRRAERAVVDLANQTLDHLSGGALMLRLREGGGRQGADDALDLEAVPRRVGDGGASGSATGEAVGVYLLSGSQKFRVAVSLALALGQYAGGRRRCGESVIIDEGFGSLDREGQEVMIRELHTLRGLLKRIILVSHQESFASSFPDGYRFRLEAGQTRAERVVG